MLKSHIISRFDKHITLITCILIFPLTIFLNGCYTTRTETVTDEQIPAKLSRQSEDEIEIISVRLNTGENISLKGKDAKFLTHYMDLANVLHYTVSIDTIRKDDGKLKVVYRDTAIELKDIKLAKIEMTKLDGVKTTFVILGIAALAVLVFYVIGVLLIAAAFKDILNTK